MSEQFEGYVSKIIEKSGQGKRGPWKSYMVKLEGEHNDKLFLFGFDTPAFKDDAGTGGNGDFIEFLADHKDGTVYNYVKKTGKIKKNAPARSEAAPAPAAAPSTAPDQTARPGRTSEVFGAMGGSYTEDDLKRITWSANAPVALDLLKLLIDHKALKLDAGTSAAKVAVRYEEIMEAYKKLQVELWHDAATLRQLDRVEDAGGVEEKVDVLPDQEESEDFNDDLPPLPPEVAEDVAI